MEQKDIKAIQLSLQEVLKYLKTLTQQVARMSNSYAQSKRNSGGR